MSAGGASDFAPRPGIRGPHLQTIAGALWPRPRLPEGDLFLVQSDPETQLVCRLHGAARGATVVVVVHGLAGSIDSGPVLDLTLAARRRGLAVLRMNMRNCGGTEHLTPTLYHANRTEDLLAVIGALVERAGAARIVLAGYSMGGSLVLNLLGALGERCPREVEGAAVICPAVDVAATMEALDGPDNRLYQRLFLRDLRGFYRRKSALFPARHPRSRGEGSRTLRAFDAAVTAPDAGFDDVDRFYAWVSPAGRIAGIAVPVLLLRAEDDPFVRLLPSSARALRAHPHVRLVETAGGGHCGFLAAPSPGCPEGRWAAERVAAFAAELTTPTAAR